jgi:hypothetical protein
MKKIVLMSLGGSVGKTMIATQCLYPHMPDAKILCVDQVNTTAKDFGIKNCETHSGDEFNRTYRALMASKSDVIVDVGGSKECKEFLDGMLAIDGSDAITTIIIPARPNSKDQGCALETIDRLIADGVDKSKIKVIFTDTKKSVETEFEQLIEGMKDVGLTPDLDLAIFHSLLFGEMIEDKELISNILADKTDYKEKIANRAKGDKTDYIGKLMRQKMAATAWPKLEAVYLKLFSQV